jgi:hypothetical protein
MTLIDIPIPDGYEFVRIGKPKCGEHIYSVQDNSVHSVPGDWLLNSAIIVRPKPPQYRPFANAAEFTPFRDKWWKFKDGEAFYIRPPVPYSNLSHEGVPWQTRFEQCVFDDGTPFGVKI